MDLEKNYKKYVKFLKAYIKRDGLSEFLTWLDHSDAIEAPASTQYHMSIPGGFIQHSLNVFNRLIRLIIEEYGDIENCPYSKETIALVSLLHDISKVNFYEVSLRNVKNPQTGQWEHVPYYSVRDEYNRLIFGNHEENSVYMVNQFFKLSYEEALAIRWHGGCGTSNDPSSQGKMMEAYRMSTLALLLHFADMQATCIDENDACIKAKEDSKKEEEQDLKEEQNSIKDDKKEFNDNNSNEVNLDEDYYGPSQEDYDCEDYEDEYDEIEEDEYYVNDIEDDIVGQNFENSIDEIEGCPF